MPARDYYLPERRLVSQEDASITERPNVPRSRFTGSWTRKTSFDAGTLIPFLIDEILPGDHITYNATAYIRMATPLFPLFDNQRIDTFFFFVPNRLLWANWAKFMGEQANPTDSIAFVVPQLTSPVGGYLNGSLADHMGLPVLGQIDPLLTITHNVLPLRAYNLIYNEWFRDQNLQSSIPFTTNDGPDALGSYAIKFRAKSHDYFTTALPWPQKFTAPFFPLAGQAQIHVGGAGGVGDFVDIFDDTAAGIRHMTSGAFLATTATPGTAADLMYADLATATGTSINTFRQAFLIQQLLERDARGGTRYVELLKSHFGVTSPDFRLQRPEYIGGGQSPFMITPIAQTAPTEGIPVGALGAAGTGIAQHTASYAATEHGYILGLINIRTELSYQQGIPRLWSRNTRFDFYWPSLAQLGEQAILRKEIYAKGDPALDDLVFGYQEAWHSYRTRYSEVTGLMRSGSSPTLDPWHLAQFFTAPPVLNNTFIQDLAAAILPRVLAAGSQANLQQYLADIMINRNAVRPVPAFGTPALLGRF